jgi:hypothetical protein
MLLLHELLHARWTWPENMRKYAAAATCVPVVSKQALQLHTQPTTPGQSGPNGAAKAAAMYKNHKLSQLWGYVINTNNCQQCTSLDNQPHDLNDGCACCRINQVQITPFWELCMRCRPVVLC